MHLISWNVRYQGLSKRIEVVTNAVASERPDVVTLQEVESKSATALVAALEAGGVGHIWHSRHGDGRYHCVIASRWPLVTAPGGDDWRADAPFPQLLGRVVVQTPTGDVDVFTAHVPNDSRHGWKKIETFEVLAQALCAGGDVPRVLTGDFNEPRAFLDSGQMVTFAGERDDVDGVMSIPDWEWKGRSLADWSAGVRSVLAGRSLHGLRDAYRDCHGVGVATPVTHRVLRGGRPCCFDHTLVSRHFEVVACGYHHEWRREGWSDHSAMWVRLRLGTSHPALLEWQVET